MLCECGEEATVRWEIDGKVKHLCMWCYGEQSQEHTKRRNEESWMQMQKKNSART